MYLLTSVNDLGPKKQHGESQGRLLGLEDPFGERDAHARGQPRHVLLLFVVVLLLLLRRAAVYCGSGNADALALAPRGVRYPEWC